MSLVKKLRVLLNKYPEIADIIVFGSFVKSKFKPADIDVMVITSSKELHNKLKITFLKNVHLEFYTFNTLFYEPLIVNVLAEGYSVRHNKFLRERLGIKPAKMFIYRLEGFSRVKKVQFSTALTKMLKLFSGERTAAGSVLIPIGSSGAFEDFLNSWGLKYKTKEYLVF